MEKLLRIKEVCEMTALGESKLRLMVDAGEFPRGRQIGSRAVRWRLADVEGWIRGLPEAVGAVCD